MTYSRMVRCRVRRRLVAWPLGWATSTRSEPATPNRHSPSARRPISIPWIIVVIHEITLHIALDESVPSVSG